ncbi:unnamed protein product [Cercospora beticola]|nr:unnamed protein product [Cercospora beticola]
MAVRAEACSGCCPRQLGWQINAAREVMPSRVSERSIDSRAWLTFDGVARKWAGAGTSSAGASGLEGERGLERATTKRNSRAQCGQGQRSGGARKADNARVWLGSQSVVEYLVSRAGRGAGLMRLSLSGF